ncbi:phage holin family protein [Xanthobacter sp. V0B-10]|uniref:phage holin family protein n=1 Tax=Xanthobacter albus TaxID=3119929 RepID=UPI003729860F
MTDLDTLVRNARVLLRADLIIAEIHLRRAATKSAFFAVAGVVGAFGLVMLGIAGFLALEAHYGPILAALIVGGGAVVLAGLLALLGAQVKPGRELGIANEVHAAALAAVNNDLQSVGAGASRLAAFVRNPLDSALPAVALSLLNTVLKGFRRKG